MKRIDDGHRLCNDLMNCVHERAKIEKSYAQQLTDWSKRWRQLIEKGTMASSGPPRTAGPHGSLCTTPSSPRRGVEGCGVALSCPLCPPGPQYGSLEKAWSAIMTEADKVSELHQEVKNSLLNDDFEKVKNWQKDAYHKQIMGGFKEAKEADDGFRKAQKPWAKKLKEVRGELSWVTRAVSQLQLWVASPGWESRMTCPCRQRDGQGAETAALTCRLCPHHSWRQPRKPTTWPARRRSWR